VSRTPDQRRYLMAIVKKHRKSGGFVWHLDERIQGRRVIRSLKTDDKQTARERYHVLAARLHREEEETASRKTSVAGLRERVVDHIGATHTEKYQKQFVFAFNFLKNAFPESTDIGDIDRSSLDAFRVKALADVKPNTVNAYFRALRTAWNLAIEWELTEKNPFAKLGELKDSTIDERDKYFSEEETQMVLNGFDDSELPGYFRSAVELSLYCGLRLSEVLTLKPGDIKNDQLLVRGKGNKVRSIPLRGPARDTALSRVNGSPWLFPSEKDHSRRVETTGFSKQFSAYCHGLGCSRGHFHMLRHTFAALLLTKGVSTIRVARWMGHSSVKVTDQVYGHLIPGEQDELIELAFQP